VALLAQNPRNGVHNIGFAAAIGADDAGQAAAAEGNLRLFAKGFEANELDFAQFKQDFPFMAYAVYALGGPVLENRLHQAHNIDIGRDVFRLTGKVRAATKSLKGRLTVAQPPGATMAVRENKLARVAPEVKPQPANA
jgi:hypothetical protein